MSYSIQTLLNDISGVVHGTTVNKIPNIYGAINRAARAVLLDVDPKETQRIVSLPQVFNSVYDYPIPVDVKGDRIIDLRLQSGRPASDIFEQDYAQTFDSQKLNNTDKVFNVQWNSGVKSLRVEAPTITSPLTICDTSTITGWTATSGASTITLDTTNQVAGGGDITFNLIAGQASGYIETSTLNSIDASSNTAISTLFLWVYMPTGTSITSVDLCFGSSSTNYYNYTATVTQQGTTFTNGWNLLAFPWISATITGSPDSTKITYLRTTFNYNSALQTGVKICNLTSNMPANYELQYYSKFLFRDPVTNAFQETVVDTTDDNKIVNLDTDSYNLLFNKTAFFIAQQLQGADAGHDEQYWDAEYQSALKRYRAMNPSEIIKKAEFYYKPPKKSYSKYSPGFWRP